jgi:glutathione S-transferase
MDLTLYLHPLASFCHKVLLALYENETPFEARVVDLGDPVASAELLARWPVGKIPVLHDRRRGQTVAETSIIIEYLARHYPGRVPWIPVQPEQALQARLWDRFFDLYVQVPMQKVVVDRLRPAGQNDRYGVEEAIATLRTAYEMIERQLATGPWAIGDALSIADCAAAPALFYAQTVLPFAAHQPRLGAYFERLAERRAFRRVIEEARPYFGNFPLRDALDPRWLRPAT